MYIDGNFISEDEIVASNNSFHKKHNNIYVTQEQITILKNYDIDIEKYSSINQLIYDIEEYLNNSNEYLEDLEWVSQSLSEYNYYNNTNK